MKYSNILNRIVTLLIFIFAMGMTSLAEAQNATQVIQAEKQESPSVKDHNVKLPNGDQKTVEGNKVQILTMEKSDKMVIVNVKDVDSNSKTVPANKTIEVRKRKSEKIDQ